MYRCPGNSTHKDFKIFGAIECIDVYIDQEGDIYDSKGGDTEWDNGNTIWCCECGYQGTVKEFWEDEE